MPSEKVTGILRSKTNLTADEVNALTEAAAWRLVYALPKPESRRDARVHVCFTGFSVADKSTLVELAEAVGHHVAASVTKQLTLLVCGSNAGPKKLEQAAAQGVMLATAEEYKTLVSTA